MTLPHESEQRFLTDGGLETTLVFLDGIDLPAFAAFPLLDREDGRAALRRYFVSYLDIAAQHGLPFVLDTPTWRANADWGPDLGYDHDDLRAVNRRAVEFARELAAGFPTVSSLLNGVIGPRGDGYVADSLMTASESAEYHSLQTEAFAEAGVDLITAVTMTYSAEAIGICVGAREVHVPVVISFTVETDGRLPSGEELGAAIESVDEATDATPTYFMVNCAHPTHFTATLREGSDWTQRIKAVRANASPRSHAELDEATELDRGDLAELAALYAQLDELVDLRVVGGCCGTDHEHIAAIAENL